MTDTTTQLHVVLGASGSAGNAILRALLEAGHHIRGVTRSGEVDLDGAANTDMVELVAADIADALGAKRAVHGADVVYMAAQPSYHRWAEEFPQMMETVIGAVAGVAAKLVMVDNLYAYGEVEGPMTEDTHEAATDTKGRVRHQMTRRLLAAHRDGEVRVAIGRASDYFGPRGDNSGITALAIEPVGKAKGGLRWMGSLDAPHSGAYLPDIARAFVVLGTDERADGRVWHLPHAPAVTGRQFLGLVNLALQDRGSAVRRTGRVSPLMLRLAAPFHKISKETLGILHQWTMPFVVDDSAFQSTFGPFPVTPLREAVAATVDHYAAVDHHTEGSR